MIKITINKLQLKILIGVFPKERIKKQKIIMDIEFNYPAQNVAEKDDINLAVDYNNLTQTIIRETEKTSFKLLETLANFVLELVFTDPKVLEAKVSITKPKIIKQSQGVTVTYRKTRMTNA